MVNFYCIIFLSVLYKLSVMSLHIGTKEKSYHFKFIEVLNLFSLNSFNFFEEWSAFFS